MKKLSLILLAFSILSILLLFFSSCTGGSTTDGGSSSDINLITEYIVKFTIDGTEFKFCNSKGRMWGEPEAEIRVTDDTLIIAGSEEDPYINYILFTIKNATDTGTYQSTGNIFKYDRPATSPLIDTSNADELIYSITHFDETMIEGTFSGDIDEDSDGTPDKTLSDGYFCVKRVEWGDINL